MGDMELYLRLAALERRVDKLEPGMRERDHVVDSQGWIGEAFHVMEEHIDAKFQQVDQRFESVDQRFREIDAKLDLILRHITGIDSNGSDA
jgi:hypothetical protein